MPLIRIQHKNLADGVLIDERQFDPATQRLFASPTVVTPEPDADAVEDVPTKAAKKVVGKK